MSDKSYDTYLISYHSYIFQEKYHIIIIDIFYIVGQTEETFTWGLFRCKKFGKMDTVTFSLLFGN
jgi:hypothetical protein